MARQARQVSMDPNKVQVFHTFFVYRVSHVTFLMLSLLDG